MKNIKNKKWIIIVILFFLIISFIVLISNSNRESSLEGVVLDVTGDYLNTCVDSVKCYKFENIDDEIGKNDKVSVKYKGKLSDDRINKAVEMVILEKAQVVKDTSSVLEKEESNGIFKDFYSMANKKLSELTLDEKVGQVLLARVPDSNAVSDINKYKLGGYVMFSKDFKDLSKSEVQKKINSYQNASDIPMIVATDEEGGSVVRASSNSKLRSTPFKSSQELYKEGGFDLIRKDTIEKSKFLSSLGVNVNLAPVADVSVNPSDYMYSRSFGKDTTLTSEYVKTVIDASRGYDVSYVLKHFPGYGNNNDTHTGVVNDDRLYNDILNNDIPPFQEGIENGAEAVLVSHNTVTNIDNANPASLSKEVHKLLRDNLKFTGVIISDDMDMGAIKDGSYGNYYTKAISGGNDMIIVTDYDKAFNQIKSDINANNLDIKTLDKAVLRVLAWKYYKLLFEEK